MEYLEPPRYVVCLDNRQNPVSLERGKLYRVVKPHANDPEGYVRIVDESDEDYLFPADWFGAVELPQPIIDALEAA